MFQLLIPLYDPDATSHRALTELAERAEQVAAAVDLPAGVSFQALRRRIRQVLATDGVTRDIDSIVRDLLSS